MIILGITGGVGCGKSVVLEYIEKNYNCFIALTDNIAHKLQQPKEKCYREIINIIGEQILDKDGIIDRKKMGEIIFFDDDMRKKINEIVHPMVTCQLEKMIEEAEGQKDIFVIESALLFESGINRICDYTWYIYASEENRIKRLKSSRNYTDEKIKNIMKSQYSEKFFFSACDLVIDNNGELEKTIHQIREELEWLDNFHCPIS